MLRTVVNQNYVGSLAVDTSGMFNHGIPVLVKPDLPGFEFDQPGSRINILPSASLLNLECIEATVSFALRPSGTPHRYNLAEGYMSFALFVNPDLSISATIFDNNGSWSGAQSAPATVTTGATHVAVMQSDGINMVRIYLDGKLVAENYGAPGPVKGVGALGIAVGHWPDPPDQYTFQGTIFQFILKKYDPHKDLPRALDACCFNKHALAQWFQALQKRGITPQQITNAEQALKSVTRDIAIALRGGNKTQTEKQQGLVSALNAALARRDCQALEVVMGEFQQFFSQLDAAKQAKFSADLQAAFAAFGLSASEWCQLMNLLCLNFCCSSGKE